MVKYLRLVKIHENCESFPPSNDLTYTVLWTQWRRKLFRTGVGGYLSYQDIFVWRKITCSDNKNCVGSVLFHCL